MFNTYLLSVSDTIQTRFSLIFLANITVDVSTHL